MNRILFLHAARDPAASGELRRLGLPAFLLEGLGWTTAFAWAERVDLVGDFDTIVVPLEALHVIPRLVSRGWPTVLVEISGPPERRRSDDAAALGAVAPMLSAIVARDGAAVAWARKVSGNTAVWLAADPAASSAELAAAALRFDIVIDEPPEDSQDVPFELWFCEPGDVVDSAEVEQLRDHWKPAAAAVAIAPEDVLTWLTQTGVAMRPVPYSPARLDKALWETRGCVFAGPPTEAAQRRRARAARGGAAAPDAHTPRHHPSAITSRWQEIIRLAAKPHARAARKRTRVLMLLDLVQDIDLALPVLDALAQRPGIEVQVVLSSWLRRRSPRVTAELVKRDVQVEVHDRRELEADNAPDLESYDAVIAVVESSLPPHTRAHRLFARARVLGLPSFSFQHGVENLGINTPDDTEAEATLLSDHLLAWFSADNIPPTVQPALRPRLIHVGRPRAPSSPPAAFLGVTAGFKTLATVFENLHWSRYSDAWRTRFLFDCSDFAEANPSTAVVLKPHHTGLWSVRNRHLIRNWPSNLILADPTDSFWEPYTAPDLIVIADLVITTPSTVALDAVLAGKPVAVAAYGMEVPAFAPLPLLHGLEDWTHFGLNAGSALDARRRAVFQTRTVMPGDAAQRAAWHIHEAAMKQRSRRAAHTASEHSTVASPA